MSLSGGDLFSEVELSLLVSSSGRLIGVLGWSQSEFGLEFDLDGEFFMSLFLCVRACCFIFPCKMKCNGKYFGMKMKIGISYLCRKSPITYRALERPLLGVRSVMNFQCRIACERLEADLTSRLASSYRRKRFHFNGSSK